MNSFCFAWAGRTIARTRIGAPEETFLPDIALILANELYLASYCRNNVAFLEKRLHVISQESSPEIKTIPSMIFERTIGYPVLSPYGQNNGVSNKRGE